MEEEDEDEQMELESGQLSLRILRERLVSTALQWQTEQLNAELSNLKGLFQKAQPQPKEDKKN